MTKEEIIMLFETAGVSAEYIKALDGMTEDEVKEAYKEFCRSMHD